MAPLSSRLSRTGPPSRGLSSRRLLAGWIAVILALIAHREGARAHLVEGNSPLVLPTIEVQVVVEKGEIRSRIHLPLELYLRRVMEIDTSQAPDLESALEIHQELPETAIHSRITKTFLEQRHVHADGEALPAEVVELELEIPGGEGADAESATPGERGLRYSALEIVLRHALQSRPSRVGVVWRLFPELDGEADAIDTIRSSGNDFIVVQFEAEGKSSLVVLERDEPEHIWHSGSVLPPPPPGADSPSSGEIPSFTLPVAAVILTILGLGFGIRARSLSASGRALGSLLFLGLAGASLGTGLGTVHLGPRPLAAPAPPGEIRGLELFEMLHENIYRAFDFTSSVDIYRTLEQSVDGPLLEQIYADIYESLVLHEEGGAVCAIRELERLESRWLGPVTGEEEAPESAFRVQSRWRIHGLVRHWGHTHEKSQEFEAIYTLAWCGDGWKITGTRILEQRPADPSGGRVDGKSFR